MTDQQTAILFLHAQTPLHPGSGTALGVVDLPVQRERHTNWPLIPGSALKGLLRDRCREQAKSNYQDEPAGQDGKPRSRRRQANEDDPCLVAAFGPGKVGADTSHAGALSVTDARLLAFPVRSLKGVFAWVTCPAVLGRLARDLALAGFPLPEIPAGPPPNHALAAATDLLVDGNCLLLEEFDFQISAGDCTAIAGWVAAHAVGDEFTRGRIQKQFVVLHDDDFTHFVKHATEVVARIGLDYEKKTVKSGALFYQEFLPPETLFYSLVFANPSRNGQAKSAAENLAYLRSQVHDGSVLQVGGDETTGKGLCCLRIEAAAAGHA